MSWLDYSAFNLGYREWSNPTTFLQGLEQEFKVNFLCANVVDKNSGSAIFKPYVIKELEAASGRGKLPFKKLSIAMLGLTDNSLAQLFVNRPGEPELLYRDPVETAREMRCHGKWPGRSETGKGGVPYAVCRLCVLWRANGRVGAVFN